MNNRYAHMFRKKLDKKIINLVKPQSMSFEEYVIACNLQEFEPSVENGQFLHWIITASGDDTRIVEKVQDAIVNALSKNYLLDSSNNEQCAYFCDAVRDMLIRDKDFSTQMLEAVLKNFDEDDDVFKFCKSLNKAFGFTSLKYFS